MNKSLLKSLAVSGAAVLALNASATLPQRIDVEDDYKTTIYCVGATDANKGVYTLNINDDNPVKISGSTYIQYSFIGSGGTFVDETKLYGTYKASYAVYAVIATAEGGAEGPWSHTFYNYTNGGNVFPFTMVAKDMTYNEADGKIYGIFKTGQYSYTWALATYDGENKTTQKIYEYPSETVITAIAADADGQLWGIISTEGKLVKIDKATGGITEVGSLGITTDCDNQSAAIDNKTGKMYWISGQSMYTPAQSLYEVDLSTGAATKRYDVASGRYNGFFIVSPKSDPSAPAAPENLTAEFVGTDTETKVTFDIPTKNFGGGTLSGDVTWTISCDGVDVASGTAQPGDNVEKTCSLPAGERTVSVCCSQGELSSPVVKTKVFVGFDTPGNISNLSLTRDGDNVSVSLTWDAPLPTHEGGKLNPDALSYTVVRNPGNVEVASGLKACEASDVVPDGYAAFYTWTVIVKYDGADGQSLTTEPFLSGNPYPVPYTQDFNGATTLADAVFSQHNNEAGGPEWEIGGNDENKYAEITSKYYWEHNDYLFSAPIEFEAGISYTLKFKIATSAVSPTYYDWTTSSSIYRAFNLDVMLTNGQSADAADKVASLGEQIDFVCDNAEKVGVFEDKTIQFTVAESGTYNICFLDKSTYFLSDISLYLDDVEVTANYPTPAAVENLTAEVPTLGSRDVTVKFTTPAKDVEGNELKSLTAIEIYRGTQLITTLAGEEVEPAAELSYVDENSPRGIHSYKVIAYNHDKASDASYASVRSGYINNLEIVNCSFPARIDRDSEEVATVEIVNNAFESAVDYRVLILIDGEESLALPGDPIAPDETKTYYFDLPWVAGMPQYVEMKAQIEYFGDENTANNTSDAYTVEFDHTDGVESITAGDVTVTASAGAIHIYNAGNLRVTVNSVSGSQVAAIPAPGVHCAVVLDHGVYVVTVGDKTFKVAL